MNRSTRLGGKTIHYHSYLAHVLSIRIPVKIVVTELVRHVLGTCDDFPQVVFSSRRFETNLNKYRYATFQRDDHTVLFPPKVDRIILQIRETEPSSVLMPNTFWTGTEALWDPCIHRLPAFQWPNGDDQNESKERASSQNILRVKGVSFHFSLNIHLSRFYGHF